MPPDSTELRAVDGKRLLLTLVAGGAAAAVLATGWLRLRSGSILPGFLMHALNSAVFLASGILILK